ncbi:NUDIX hydrolase [Deinococcus sp. SDU3-2]|uniref:NUDIX hydrolase n=1 Tax=Deinococcus terrestris TaxID=2651870 RepID=A0A7X1NWL6_9DEIO|nr:NUDIX hydrolase [Deinococcus terrestris]MPY67171.1 NUDIX hydrolase [Deinococcus terrestris]
MTPPPPEHPNWAALVPGGVQPWKTLSSRVLVDGFRVVLEDRVQTPSGAEVRYQYRPRGPRATFVLPVTPEGEAVLIRQFRYPLGATVWEVVAGGVERGEDLLKAAARELAEEVGGVAGEWVPLPAFYPQPSISGVVFYSLLALGVRLGDTAHEDSEVIERVTLPLPEVYRMLEAGEIHDGPSSLTLWHARRHLEERGLL